MPHIALDATGVYSRNIPPSTPTVMGYVTGYGGVPWTAAQFAAFHHSGVVHINQDNSTDPKVGALFDLEANAGTIAGAVKWAQAKRGIGGFPYIYVQASNASELEDALAHGGVDAYGIHLANWNYNAVQAEKLLHGRVRAVQFASPSSNPNLLVPNSHLTLAQANVDVSVCADDYFPPPRVFEGPHGIANASVHIDLGRGDWHVNPEEGHIVLGHGGTGHWDIQPMKAEGDYWCAKVRIHRGT